MTLLSWLSYRGRVPDPVDKWICQILKEFSSPKFVNLEEIIYHDFMFYFLLLLARYGGWMQTCMCLWRPVDALFDHACMQMLPLIIFIACSVFLQFAWVDIDLEGSMILLRTKYRMIELNYSRFYHYMQTYSKYKPLNLMVTFVWICTFTDVMVLLRWRISAKEDFATTCGTYNIPHIIKGDGRQKRSLWVGNIGAGSQFNTDFTLL